MPSPGERALEITFLPTSAERAQAFAAEPSAFTAALNAASMHAGRSPDDNVHCRIDDGPSFLTKLRDCLSRGGTIVSK